MVIKRYNNKYGVMDAERWDVTNVDLAKVDPGKVYKRPHDVVVDATLSRAQKIDILRRWEYDQREIAVAEEENMQASSNSHMLILEEILKSLLELKIDDSDESPTKEG